MLIEHNRMYKVLQFFESEFFSVVSLSLSHTMYFHSLCLPSCRYCSAQPTVSVYKLRHPIFYIHEGDHFCLLFGIEIMIVWQSSSFIHACLLRTQDMIHVRTRWYETLMGDLDPTLTFIRGWSSGLSPFLSYFSS